jgi:biotin carboxyl carrier protein
LKKGDKLCKILVPLVKIIENKEEAAHWTFGRGVSVFGNVLSYQPELSYWNPQLRLRLVKLDRAFGSLRISSPNAGKVKIVDKPAIGSSIPKGHLIASIDTEPGEIKIESPVAGTMSSLFVEDGEIIPYNHTIARIRTFPLLLVINIEEDFKMIGDYCYSTIRSPLNGTILKDDFHSLNCVDLPTGTEITIKNAIVCIIKIKDILLGISIADFSGYVVENYVNTNREIKVGEPLFKFRPKYYFLRSPMMGKFYRRIATDEPPCVNIGDHISQYKVVCVIEALKINNEIESLLPGTVISIYADDEENINYEQILFKIQLYE